jgi:hypothetical protein
MEDVMSSANTIAYILFTVIGVMFYLFKQGQDEKFRAMKETIDLLREESKSDDRDVKTEIAKVDGLRVDQITKLHERVGQTERCIAKSKERISTLEGLHKEHK